MKKGKLPLISIIVSTKNEAGNIKRLLKSISRQKNLNHEVIIVDNFSTDSTLSIAQQYTSLVYLHGHERSSQRNFGAHRALGKYLLFLDADMELPPLILDKCIETFKKYDASAIIIPETNTAKSFFGRIKRLEKLLYLNEPAIEAPRFFTKKIFFQVGGYNERLIAGEDWDLGSRILKNGTISRITSPLIHHEDSFLRELKHKLYYARHIRAYQKKHPDNFSRQSGINRFYIYLKKKSFYTHDPVASVGLILLKTIECIIYKIITRMPYV